MFVQCAEIRSIFFSVAKTDCAVKIEYSLEGQGIIPQKGCIVTAHRACGVGQRAKS